MFAGIAAAFRSLAATALLLLVCAVSPAQQVMLPVETIDLYGSPALDFTVLRAELEPDILRYVATLETVRTNPNADLQELESTARASREKVAAELGKRVPLAHVSIAAITSFAPSPHINVTIDVVEQADAARRR